MMRTKVYTSEGDVIWVSNKRSESVSTPSGTPSHRPAEKHASISIERQDRVNSSDVKANALEPSHMVDEEDMVEGEEVLMEEIVQQDDEDEYEHSRLETEASSWPPKGGTADDDSDIPYKLAKWSSEYRIADGAMDDLLKLLKGHSFPDLPESSRSLKACLKGSGRDLDDEHVGDDLQAGHYDTRSKANRKRALESEKKTVTVDVDQLNGLMKKMDIIDQKLDHLSSKGTEHSKMLKTVLKEIKVVKQSVSGSLAFEADFVEPVFEEFESKLEFPKICFPVKDQADLLRLEKFCQEEQGEAALRHSFNAEPAHNYYEYLRSNVERLFRNTARYSWTGKAPHNAKFREESNPACDLHIMRILADCTMKRFGQPYEVCVQTMIKALSNYNAAVQAKTIRSLNKSGVQQSEDDVVEA